MSKHLLYIHLNSLHLLPLNIYDFKGAQSQFSINVSNLLTGAHRFVSNYPKPEFIFSHINNEIMVSGRTVKVLKVMACDEEWIFRNYINPLKRAFNKEAEYERRRPLPPPQPVNIRPPVIIVQPPPKQSYMPPPPAPKRGKEDISCCCCF